MRRIVLQINGGREAIYFQNGLLAFFSTSSSSSGVVMSHPLRPRQSVIEEPPTLGDDLEEEKWGRGKTNSIRNCFIINSVLHLLFAPPVSPRMSLSTKEVGDFILIIIEIVTLPAIYWQ